jgi:hypothetical protein
VPLAETEAFDVEETARPRSQPRKRQPPPPGRRRWLIAAGVGIALLAVVLIVWLLNGDKADTSSPSRPGDDGDGRPRTADVSGTVKLSDGRPLPAGWIAFHGRDASETALAPIGGGGRFTATGVPVGDNIRVTVDVASIDGALASVELRLRETQTRADLMRKAGKEDPTLINRMAEMTERRKRLNGQKKALQGLSIEPRFTRKETTSLIFKIGEGPQTIDVVLGPGN